MVRSMKAAMSSNRSREGSSIAAASRASWETWFRDGSRAARPPTRSRCSSRSARPSRIWRRRACWSRRPAAPRRSAEEHTMTALRSIRDRLKAVLNDRGSKGDVAGAVVGVSVGAEEVVLAHGSANLNTNQPFTEDTGFLLGSVTKVLVTTVLMRLVERGLVDLDAPAKRYVPEFALSDKDAAAAITVRMLVNHTNGIDSDTLCPWSVRGRDANRSYTQYLPKLGVLFEPGTCLHYSNPGFVVAARVIEEQTGLPFERAMQSELFDP